MAVHITIYPDERAANELRQFIAAHACTATEAVELLLAHLAATEPVAPRVPLPPTELPHPAAA